MAEDTGTPGTEQGKTDDDPQGSPGTTDTPRTFSEEDVNRIVKERLARQKTQYEGFDELKAKAAKFDEIEEANRTELEKAQKAATDAAAERDKILAEVREARLTAAVLAEVAKTDRKVVDPGAALRLLDRSTLELGEDGVPTNTAEAVDALLESMPFLVVSGGSARGNADQGARKGGKEQLSRASLKDMSPDEINQARLDGRLDGILAGRQ